MCRFSLTGPILSTIAILTAWWRGDCVVCGVPVVDYLPLWRRPWPERCSECDDGPQV